MSLAPEPSAGTHGSAPKGGKIGYDLQEKRNIGDILWFFLNTVPKASCFFKKIVYNKDSSWDFEETNGNKIEKEIGNYVWWFW